MKYDSTASTLEHIRTVATNINKFVIGLIQRGNNHDQSKLETPEKELFDQETPLLEQLTYGSPDYKKSLERLGPALNHHYANNSHHPQHYSNGIDDMDLLDIVEMYCDWKAAVARTKDGSFDKSMEINAKRYKMSRQLYNIFMNTSKRDI